MPSRPRVLTIPASRPFLATLARALLDGRIVPGWPDAADPLSLASGTILLPTRRACRALRETFAEIAGSDAGGGGALLLPRIAPIGDIDEDEWAFADPMPPDVLGLEAIGPAMAPLDRRLTLATLIRRWAASVDRAVMRLEPDDPLIVSTATSDALALAADLMRLMDQVETERVPWSRLDAIVDGGLDDFWRMTREFLAIATEHWPAHLKALGLEEPAVRRDRLIAAETVRLAALPGPLVAAGSTGSIPATRDLLRMVAHHPRGALVLPGLDTLLDAPSWEAIGASGAAAEHAHPQFGLKRLIGHVGVTRAEVSEVVPPAPHGREALVSEAMRPAETTDLWAERRIVPEAAALDGLTIIEAANEREEALAVAIVLRGVAEDPAGTAVLVTPDRALAVRVAAELTRWEVAVDDSGGRPLSGMPAAAVARLAAAIALRDPAPADLLALIAHPALAADLPPARQAAAVAAVELTALRGLRPAGGLAGYLAAMEAARPGRPRPDAPASRVTGEALDDGRALLRRAAEALAPLADLTGAGEPPLAALAGAHAAALAALGLDPGAPGAAETAAVLAAAAGGTAADFTLPARDYPAVFETLIATETVRLPADPGARIRILGLPEARLIDAGTVVMAGLVEGTWPGEARLDPWLNRAMRASLGIEPPERRIGLAAHDFCQLLGHPRVVLSHAAKKDGVPTVPSRWLQRLQAVLGGEAWDRLAARGRKFLAFAAALDDAGPARPAPRPSPAPPLTLRPARLSVTEIETWQRDPYAIYARHVLKLAPLDALDEVPGAAERGTIVHGVLDAYTREVSAAGPPPDPVGRLLTLGREAFAPFWDDPAVRAIWWPRFIRIAAWFAAADAERRAAFPTVHAENRGELSWTTPAGRPFTLVTKADRIDIAPDGRAEVVDYKTGRPPTSKQVCSGLSPQLPLEAAVLKGGGFSGIDPALRLTGLVYARLGGREPAGELLPVDPGDRTLDELVAETLDSLKALVAAFEDERQGYVSWAMPQFVSGRSNDYAHLARVKEWSTAEGAE